MKPLQLAAALLIAGQVSAGPFTELIVFGDSLSDIGNISAATFGIQPGPDYFNGRFSNGPVYAERLAIGLGLGPLVRSGVGGGNYAHGGAETDGPNGFFDGGFLIDSLVEQVDAYLGDLDGSPANPDALHVVFIGGNDFLNGQSNAATPAGVVQSELSRLVGAGAQNFLGINLPNLNLTPNNLGDAGLSAVSTAFNVALEGVYSAVEASNPGVTIYRLDVETILDDLAADPAPLGFTNVTGQGIGAPDPAGYLFWDGIHPSREAHALLGEAALRAVLPAGDYDRDGFVTPADFTVWATSHGAAFNATAGVTLGIEADANGDGRVDAADFALWREASPVLGTAVPEPTTTTCLVTAAISAAACWTRRRGQ